MKRSTSFLLPFLPLLVAGICTQTAQAMEPPFTLTGAKGKVIDQNQTATSKETSRVSITPNSGSVVSVTHAPQQTGTGSVSSQPQNTTTNTTTGSTTTPSLGEPLSKTHVTNQSSTIKRQVIKKSRYLPGQPSAENGNNPVILRVFPGVNEMVSISRSQPNRIATPFVTPQVIGAGTEEYVYEGSDIYLSTKSSVGAAVGIFIRDKDNPGSDVISLTLLPKEVPGQTIIVQVEGSNPNSSSKNGKNLAGKTETHTDVIRLAMKSVATNQMPPGYNGAPINDLPVARMGQIRAEPMRRYSSSRADIYEYSLTNTGENEITVTEQSFYREGIMAISIFPKFILRSGDKTSLFIMASKNNNATARSNSSSTLSRSYGMGDN